MTRTDEALERIAAVKEQHARRRKHEEAFALFATIVVFVVNVGYLWRGGEASFRSTVVVLLSVVAVSVARRRL
jgi:hypothetical protein